MINDLISGGLAGILSRTLTAPLELYKIQAQNRFIPHSTIQSVLKKEGLRYLWKGNGINCLRVCPQISINYAVFKKTKYYLNDIPYQKSVNFLSGLVGGTTAIICIYPLETIRTRLSLQTQHSHYSGIIDCFQKMNIKNMYQGLGTSILGSAPFSALCFGFFYAFKTKWPDQKLLGGALSGAAAVTFTYPTDLIRRRLQLQGFDSSVPKYSGLINCVKTILKHNGIRGLYKGLGACYFKIIPTSAIQFWVLEFYNETFI